MAAAYAALVSVMQIIDQIQNHHSPPICLDKQQVESLTTNVTFLQEFLEGYEHGGYSKEADALEMRIADVAHAVEDVIESHIVDQILADGELPSTVDFHQALQKVIDDMKSVKKEVMDGRETKGGKLYQLHGDSSSASTGTSSVRKKRSMVGVNHIILQVLDKLTGNKQYSRQIISIAGMGGMGKTTLARNVYEHQRVVECFDFLYWVTISPKYEIREILLKLLEGEGKDLSQLEEAKLGYELHKKLSGRIYFIIMDDVWSIEVWEGLKIHFPDNGNGSRIMITTRLSNLAREIDGGCHYIEMDFLDQDNSWELFCRHVFGEEECPNELKETGNKIVEGCKGLPLSISVVGGLLAKSPRTQQHWEYTAENLNSIVNLEDDEHCLQVLYMSYISLPAHLKPCFLYMGGFYTDMPILLITALWVAEGFVKPIYGKSLEETAKEYVIELIDRNLLLIDKMDKPAYWMFLRCILHDLLRDLCLRESEKQKFLFIPSYRGPNIPDSMRRISIAETTPEEEVLPILKSASHLRSLRCYKPTLPSSIEFPLLRVALVNGINDLDRIVQHVNLRVMFLEVPHEYRMPSTISRFWNLQALFIEVMSSDLLMVASQVWMMPQLRCILGDRFCLPDCPHMPDCNVVLENLHTIGIVHNFKCCEEVVKRIPHIKTLSLCYRGADEEESSLADYCLNNLEGLQELEQLSIEVQFMQTQIVTITFPHSLKVLILFGTSLHWDDVSTKIGSLPLLEYLRLDLYSCIGAEWETIEGNFCSLKFLLIFGCSDLENWVTESTHFPRLQSLVLHDFHKLNKIPSCIGDITTLEFIEVKKCCDFVCDSAERIKEEQEELGNEYLVFQVLRSQREEEKDNVEEKVEAENNSKDGTESYGD